MTCKPDTQECVCAECGATFALPAVAICPECQSRQVRRREQRSSVLMEAFNVLAVRPAATCAREAVK